MKRAVEFYSEGFKLCGDVYTPDGLAPGEIRSGVLLCHGYTGVKDLYLPDNARVLNQAGYAVMTFDYKGWGESEGSRSRLAPYSRVADVQAAMTYLGMQPEVDENRIGLLAHWESVEAHDQWTKSEAFRRAHSGMRSDFIMGPGESSAFDVRVSSQAEA